MARRPGKRFRRIFLSSVALSILVTPLSTGALAANDCEPSIATVSKDPLGYRQRVDRCEGIYWEPHSSRDSIFIASFTTGDPSLESPFPAALSISWSADAATATSNPLHIRVTSLNPELFFRMDARRPRMSAGFLWPTDVLKRLPLNQKELGFVGEITEYMGGVKWTVALPLAIGGVSDVQDLTAVFLATTPVTGVNWACQPIDVSTGLPTDDVIAHGRLNDSFEAFQPIHITLSVRDFAGPCQLNIWTESAGLGPGSPLTTAFVIHASSHLK
jgi:hypothetical protein